MATLGMDGIRHQKPVYLVKFDGVKDEIAAMDMRPPNASKYDWGTEFVDAAREVDYYAPTALPPAATPAWTLVGVDHSTLDSGSHLEISGAGTDQSSYGLSPAALAATDTFTIEGQVKVDAGLGTYSHGFTVVRNGKTLWVYVLDGVVQVQHPFGTPYDVWAGDTTTAAITVRIQVTEDDEYELWVKGGAATFFTLADNGNMEAVVGTYAIEFGKISTASENGASYWYRVSIWTTMRRWNFADEPACLGRDPVNGLSAFAMGTYDYDGSGVGGTTTYDDGEVTLASAGGDWRYGHAAITEDPDKTNFHAAGYVRVGSGFAGAKSAVLALVTGAYDVRCAVIDGTVTAYDAGVSAGASSMTTTSEIRVDVWLDSSDGAYEVWAAGTLIASGTATAGTNTTTGCFFGKWDDDGTDEDIAQTWRQVLLTQSWGSLVKDHQRGIGGTINTGTAGDTVGFALKNGSGAEFDLSGGVPSVRLWLEDASAISQLDVTLFTWDGGYYYLKTWEFTTELEDGWNTLNLADGEEDTHSHHASLPSPQFFPEGIEEIRLGFTMAGTAGTSWFLEHVYVEQPRVYSTGTVRDVSGLLPEATANMDAASGGTPTGTYDDNDTIVGGWRSYTSGSSGGFERDLDGTALPGAATPAWTPNYGTALGTLTTLASGAIRITADGVNTERWSTSFLADTADLAGINTGIYVEARAKVDPAMLSSASCNLRVYLGDYYVVLKILPDHITVDTGGIPQQLWKDFTQNVKIGLTIINRTGAWRLSLDDMEVASGTGGTHSGFARVEFGQFDIATAGLTQDWDYIKYTSSYSDADFSVEDDDELGGYCQRIDVASGGRTASRVFLNTDFAIPLRPGRRYRLVVFLKASVAYTFGYGFFNTNPAVTYPSTNLSAFPVPADTARYTRVEIPFVAGDIGNGSSLLIYLGGGLLSGNAGTVWVGRAQVERERSTSLYETNGVADGTYTTFDEAASIRQGYVDKIKGSGQTVSPESGTTSIPSLTFRVVDRADEVLNLILENELQGSQVSLYRGYRDVCPDDYALTNIFRVDRTKLNADGTAYEFTAPVELDRLKGAVLPSADDAPDTITVGSGDGTGLDNIVDVFMRLATSTSAGGNGAWDDGGGVGPLEGEGLGIDISRFDATAIAAERDDWLSSWTVQYTFADRIKDLMRWSGTEVFALVGAYLYITDEGLISIRRRRAPLFNEALETLDSTKIINNSMTWERSAAKGVYNRVTFEYNYDEAENEYTSRVSYDDSRTVRTVKGVNYTSQELYGVKELTLKSQGVQGAISTSMLEARAAEVFARYAYAPPTLSAKVRSGVGWISPGDIFRLTDATPPNIKGGARGYAEVLVEVEKATPDFDNGTWDVSFVDSGFARYRTGRISAISLVYTDGSVTDLQRNAYLWIASADNLMGDGSDAYVIAQG